MILKVWQNSLHREWHLCTMIFFNLTLAHSLRSATNDRFLAKLLRQHEYPTSEFSVVCGQGFSSKVPLTRFWSCDIDLVMCSRHFFPFPYSKIAFPKLHWWFDLKNTNEKLHAIPDKSYRLSFCKTILTWPICFRLKSKAVTCRCVVIALHTMSNVRRDDPE